MVPLETDGSGPSADARQPRLSRDELRSVLLDAGRATLLEHGLQTQASSLAFKAALDHAAADKGLRFSNASIIGHIWRDRREFRLDVLTAFASIDFRSDIDGVMAAISPVVAGSDLSTEASRAIALREGCRVGGAWHVEALRHWVCCRFRASPEAAQTMRTFRVRTTGLWGHVSRSPRTGRPNAMGQMGKCTVSTN